MKEGTMQIFSQIQDGTILRFKSRPLRDWICIHRNNCQSIPKHKKHTKNETGFYLFSGLWYEGNILTSVPYGKTLGQLEAGMLTDIEIVGHISENKKFNIY